MLKSFAWLLFLIGFAVIYYFIRRMAYSYIADNAEKLIAANDKLGLTCVDDGNFLMKEFGTYKSYVSRLGLEGKYSCSRQVVQGAFSNPLKYLMKYSNVDVRKECLEQIDFLYDYLCRLGRFSANMNELKFNLKELLPVWVLLVIKHDKLPYLVCGVDFEVSYIRNPMFVFYYISPAGRNRLWHRIDVTDDMVYDVRYELLSKMSKEGHAKLQRSIMTRDLREAIKKRDNYTCKICGNSVYKEPNLLLEVDHIVPVSKGGTTEASNLQTLCWRCNRNKSNKM